MRTVSLIAGAEQLVRVFGSWPSFHEAEVRWLQLDLRPSGQGQYGPTLDVLIHTFELTDEVGADWRQMRRCHVLAHLRFTEVADLRLDAFSYRHELVGLTLTDLRDRQMERVRWAVAFDPSEGVGASFQCFAVEVVSVVPCDAAGEPTHAGPGRVPSNDDS